MVKHFTGRYSIQMPEVPQLGVSVCRSCGSTLSSIWMAELLPWRAQTLMGGTSFHRFFLQTYSFGHCPQCLAVKVGGTGTTPNSKKVVSLCKMQIHSEFAFFIIPYFIHNKTEKNRSYVCYFLTHFELFWQQHVSWYYKETAGRSFCKYVHSQQSVA